ncbi:hypothetical protein [Streptomyces sp. NBC_01185]|uniref:hypothetical protein n=1 Tax=Streptomyces sp. NBC_01185 TaxID=2903764 RepID=UPI00386C5DAD|nr:hypothetical protein OG770_32320 [Streptomyces sp. NBC_01185]
MQLDFPPILNGIDYLASVVDLLLADPLGPRELKYAVIHLNAAAEVLLKARLQDEHWSLVFDDPRKATRRAFASGTFTSCTMADAVTRLRDTAQVALTDDEQNALKRLGQDRNALQHYGLTHSARAVESRTGQALDFLLRFLKEELLSGDREEAGLNDEVPWNLVRDISVRARDISSYRTERRKRLRGVLRDVARHTLTCHECGELALVIGDRCHFCNFPIGGFPPEHVADMVLIFEALTRGGPDPQTVISRCVRCLRRAWVPAIATAADSTLRPFCFNCAAPVPEWTVALRPPEVR